MMDFEPNQSRAFIGLAEIIYWSVHKIGLFYLAVFSPDLFGKFRFFSKLRRVRALELELQLVCDQGDEFTVRGLALCVGNGVAEESLQGIQMFIA